MIPARLNWRGAALEQGTLFASVLKWTTLGVAVGILGGASTALFLTILQGAIHAADTMPYRWLLLPAGFTAAYLLVHLLARDAEGHGTEKIIEAVHRKSGRIPLRVAPVKLAATVITIAAGGSVGKEGPAAQIGASLVSGLASLLWLRRRDRRKLVICGISAGFASVFGTPIAGAIFGVEVLVVGRLFYDVLYPSFIAGIVAYEVATHLGITYMHESFAQLPALDQWMFGKTLLAGAVFGITALVMIEALRAATAIARRVSPAWLRAAGGGALLGILAWVFTSRYLGLGVDTIEQAIHGGAVPAPAFLLKIVFTAISLAVGGSGGIITPVFFVGATAGHTFATLLGFDPATFAAIGMVALLAAATNAPIAASIMAIELFGPALGPVAAIACVVSFLIVGHRSVYGSQLLGAAKSGSLKLRTEIAIDDRLAVVLHRRGFRRRVWRLAVRRTRRSIDAWRARRRDRHSGQGSRKR